MHIEFTCSRGPDYFRRQLRPAGRLVVRTMLIQAGIFAACGFAALWSSDGEGIGALVGLFVVLLPIGIVLQTFRAYRQAVTVPESWTGPRTYIITDDGVETSTELTSSTWTWAAFRRADAGTHAYLLWPDGPGAIDVPRTPLSTEDDRTLRAFLVERKLLAA